MRTRVEKYLAKLDGEQVELPAPITREERFLAKLAGMDVEVPTPITRLEQFLNILINRASLTLTPITREEIFIAQNAGYAADSLMPVTREEQYWYDIFNHGGIATYDKVIGRIVSFITRRAAPLKIEATLSPIQDLHGYEAPWPPGGGKNKLKPTAETTTENQVTFTVESDGTIKTSGTASATTTLIIGEFAVANGTGYEINGLPATGSNTTFSFQGMRGNTVAFTVEGSQDNHYTGTADETLQLRLVIRNGFNASGLTFKPMVRLSSVSDATFSPYSNECPIGGHTGADVNVTGSNIWGGSQMKTDILAKVPTSTSGTDASGSYVYWYANATTSGKVLFQFPFKEKTRYTLILALAKENANASTNILISYTDGTYSYANIPQTPVANTKYIYAVTTQANKTVSKIATVWGSAGVFVYYDECGVFEGVLTADQFEPYSGTTVTVNFGQTVYGGELTVNEDGTGSVVANMAEKDMGSIGWGYNQSGYMFSNGIATEVKKPSSNTQVANILSSLFATKSAYSIGTGANGVGIESGGNIRAKTDGMGTDPDAFRTAMSGVQIVYELATPITIPLTPGQVEALQGNNTIWVDDSSEIKVTFRTDANGTAILPYTGQGKAGYMTI